MSFESFNELWRCILFSLDCSNQGDSLRHDPLANMMSGYVLGKWPAFRKNPCKAIWETHAEKGAMC